MSHLTMQVLLYFIIIIDYFIDLLFKISSSKISEKVYLLVIRAKNDVWIIIFVILFK